MSKRQLALLLFPFCFVAPLHSWAEPRSETTMPVLKNGESLCHGALAALLLPSMVQQTRNDEKLINTVVEEVVGRLIGDLLRESPPRWNSDPQEINGVTQETVAPRFSSNHAIFDKSDPLLGPVQMSLAVDVGRRFHVQIHDQAQRPQMETQLRRQLKKLAALAEGWLNPAFWIPMVALTASTPEDAIASIAPTSTNQPHLVWMTGPHQGTPIDLPSFLITRFSHLAEHMGASALAGLTFSSKSLRIVVQPSQALTASVEFLFSEGVDPQKRSRPYGFVIDIENQAGDLSLHLGVELHDSDLDSWLVKISKAFLSHMNSQTPIAPALEAAARKLVSGTIKTIEEKNRGPRFLDGPNLHMIANNPPIDGRLHVIFLANERPSTISFSDENSHNRTIELVWSPSNSGSSLDEVYFRDQAHPMSWRKGLVMPAIHKLNPNSDNENPLSMIRLFMKVD